MTFEDSNKRLHTAGTKVVGDRDSNNHNRHVQTPAPVRNDILAPVIKRGARVMWQPCSGLLQTLQHSINGNLCGLPLQHQQTREFKLMLLARDTPAS